MTELEWLREQTPRLCGPWESPKSNPGTENGWQEWGKHVLAELERLNKQGEEQTRIVMALREDIAGLKVKAGIWGLVGGMLPALAALLYVLLK